MSYCLETNLGHDDLDPTSSNIKLDLFLMMLHMCSKYCSVKPFTSNAPKTTKCDKLTA